MSANPTRKLSGGKRDYSLTGPASVAEFSHSDWYATPIPRKTIKRLMKRSNVPGLVNYGIWLSLLAGTGTWLALSWGGPWAYPAAFFYGIFYGSCADSRWHECSHGTVFRTGWLNDAFYHLASFMSLKNPYLWRWSHTRHHTDTLVVGRDPEIAFPRPPSIGDWLLNLLYVPALGKELKKMVMLSLGILTDDQKDFLIESERAKTFLVSRVHLTILLGVTASSVLVGSWLPLMLVGLPAFYGSWLHHILATTQHAGLAEDIPDHRMNSRTVYLNPFFRFVYSNMNYHVEHHMFPMVPFYSLPELHEEIKADCPVAYPSLFAAYKEIIPAVIGQQTDCFHYVRRALPETANPTPAYSRPADAGKVEFVRSNLATE